MATVYLFRRDLRLSDNAALARCFYHSCRRGTRLLPVVVVDPETYGDDMAFALECVESLRRQLRGALCVLHGSTATELRRMTESRCAESVWWSSSPRLWRQERSLRHTFGGRARPVLGDWSLSAVPRVARPSETLWEFMHESMRDGGLLAPLESLRGAVLARVDSRAAHLGSEGTLATWRMRHAVGPSAAASARGGRRVALELMRAGDTRVLRHVSLGCVSSRELLRAWTGDPDLTAVVWQHERECSRTLSA